MRRPVLNSKMLLTITQRSLAIIIAVIMFIIAYSLYFYNQINQNWCSQAHEKANFAVSQMENRLSNYLNCIYTIQNNQKVQYLSVQKKMNFSYTQSVYISEVSELISNVTSPITEISNAYLYFPQVDLMVDRSGSSNLAVFQKYGNMSSPYASYSESDALYHIGRLLQNESNSRSSDMEIYAAGQAHYLVFPGRSCSLILVINDSELSRQLQSELITMDAFLEVYDGEGNLFAQNYIGSEPEHIAQSLSFSLVNQAYGFQYFFHFNMLPCYDTMLQLSISSVAACLALICVIICIMWSLKKRLYNPLNDLLQKYHLQTQDGVVNEYGLVEMTFQKYDAISNELETMRSELDQELESYTVNQLIYEYAGNSRKDFPPEMAFYSIVIADFETDSGEKDMKNSRVFYEKLKNHFRVVRILSSTYSDVYMVLGNAQQKLWETVSSALNDSSSGISICGISSLFTGTCQLKTAYRQAQRALWENGCAQHSLLRYCDIQDKKPSTMPLYSEQETRFLNSVLSHNYTDMEQNYEQLVKLYQSAPLGRQHKFFVHLYDMLCIILTNEQIDPDEFFQEISGQLVESILSSCNIAYLTKQLRICYQKYILSCAKNKDALLEMMTDFIDRNISRNISLQELADEMHLSYSYMGRYFRSHMDMGFVEYVQLRKITLAQDLLLHTQMNLAEIAEKTGFTTVNSFFRTFKKVAGITPTQYRKEFG